MWQVWTAKTMILGKGKGPGGESCPLVQLQKLFQPGRPATAVSTIPNFYHLLQLPTPERSGDPSGAQRRLFREFVGESAFLISLIKVSLILFILLFSLSLSRRCSSFKGSTSL